MKQKFMTWVKSRLAVMGYALPLVVLSIICGLSTVGAEEKVPVFPQSTYDAYIIYQNLAIFWIFILGLIIIILMKLREIERTQKLGADNDNEDAPRLE
ncbi:MAG: hypothetical protein JXA41_06045 [Deltaproteobacteria bacterium]|nr:hypothetical protein [Deltaproteobacteria bacterium]